MVGAFIALAVTLFAGCGALSHSDRTAPVDGGVALRRALRLVPVPVDERGRQRHEWLQHFYQRRGGQPAWTGVRGVRARADELLDELDDTAAHGLDPEAYGRTELHAAVARLRARPNDFDPESAAAVDIGLTTAFLACADDLRRGAVDPASITVSWQVRRPATDLSGLLATAISLGQVGVNLRRLAPSGLEYRRLQQALAGLTAGARAADGLRANLERWRWLPRDLGSRYLLVRIADFELDYVVDGARQTHRVIVGEPYRQTPQFASEVTHVVVHPSWHVPPRISDEELAPGPIGAERSSTLTQQGFEAWTHGNLRVHLDSLDWDRAAGFSSRYRLVQRPGGSNPLGRIKLDLVNPFAIYLHDTPGSTLFTRADRDLSHGCVRVEGIVELVRQLLESSPGRRRRFDRLLAAGETGRVYLPEPLPAYILYWTVSVTPSGQIRSTEDLYDVDARLLRALNQATGARHWVHAQLRGS